MEDQSFGPERRVRKRQDFLRIQGGRRKFRTAHLLLALSPREGHEERANSDSSGAPSLSTQSTVASSEFSSRLGITITTKVHKRAVKRNKVKRFLREYFRKNHRKLTEIMDIVVIGLEGCTELSYQEICSEMDFALKRTGLLRRGPNRGIEQRKRSPGEVTGREKS